MESAPAATAAAGPSKAPYRHIPRTAFASVEYPSRVSHPSSLLKVITQDDLNQCFNTPTNTPALLEMSYRQDDKNGIPVRGNRVHGQKLLLRIRKRRKKNMDENAEQDGEREEGIFLPEVIGSIPQSVRFRQMSDFHFTPNPETRISTLHAALKDLDYTAILDYQVAPLDEIFYDTVDTGEGQDPDPKVYSLLDLQPPPVFSYRGVPPMYMYKNAAQSHIQDFENPITGETKQRYVHSTRAVQIPPQKTAEGAVVGDVPQEMAKAARERSKRLNPELLAKIYRLFQERPCWLRHALMPHFTPAEQKLVKNEKTYLATACYYISGGGPFFPVMVRLGYDPRAVPEGRFYQRIYYYYGVHRGRGMILKAASVESSEEETEKDAEAKAKESRDWWEKEQQRRIAAGERGPLDRSKDYIFDGQILHRDRPDYQICDIIDPVIKKYIDDPELVADEFHPYHGWYKPAGMNLIKNIMRVRYQYLRDKGEEAPISAYQHEIEAYERLKGEAEDEGDTGADVEDQEMREVDE